ncbi:hypothetical protein ES708_09278 [subsurface metagenome]
MIVLESGTCAQEGIGRPDYQSAVDLAAQSLPALKMDIVTQTLEKMAVDIAAQTLSAMKVDISAQTLSRMAVDIAAQTLSAMKINVVAQTLASLDFNIKAASILLNLRLADQTKGIMLETDWATKGDYDIHLQGETADLAAGAEATLVTLTLSTTKEHWLYIVHISGTKNGRGRVRANKTDGYDELADGYFLAGHGFIKNWPAPVKRKRDDEEGITEIVVVVKNTDASAGDFTATLDGLYVVDIAWGEKIYTTKANWEGCASKSQVDLDTSEGDVLLAVQP